MLLLPHTRVHKVEKSLEVKTNFNTYSW